MKYAGTIAICDEKGSVVYDRDLEQDEIIQELLGSRASSINTNVTKSGRLCSLCEEPGHTVRTCPKNKPETFGFKKKERQEPKKRQKTCGQCGKKGHQSNSCGDEDRDVSTGEFEPLTSTQFEDVKLGRTDGLKSLEIANEMNVPLKEVNMAFSSSSYQHYLDNRKEK